MSDNLNRPVDFDESAARAGEAAQEAARQMEEAARDAAAAAEAATAGKADDLTDELNRLGNQVADQAKAVWESEQRKDIQGQVVKGLSSVAVVVEEQFKKLSANADTQRFVAKVEEATNKVVESARESKSLQDAAEVILKGLNSAALSIEKWLGQQKAAAGEAKAAAPSPDEPQDIAIQRAFPSADAPPAESAPTQPKGDEPLTYV